MASPGALRPRWGQPMTGIVSFFVFFFVAWFIWYIFSDPRGPVGSFPYPFVLYLAMMILVGLWQHMFMGDWPFHKLSQPARGIVETIFNLVLVWFVIHVVFYRILGLGFNFLSESNLEAWPRPADRDARRRAGTLKLEPDQPRGPFWGTGGGRPSS